MLNIGKFSKKKEFDINSLTKHLVVLGATGSGKTVLCKSVIEEAILKNIPVIAIDPKGDISSLGICSKNFSFKPFSDVEAKINSKTNNEYEKELKEIYKKNLKNSNVKQIDIKNYCDKINIDIYTPKSKAGKGIFVAPNLKVPQNFKQLYEDDNNITSTLIEPVAETLLSLIDYPMSAKKEITLITKIIEEYWLKNKDLEIIQLIHSVDEPPFEKIGALNLDSFISKKQRQLLASKLNLILTTPSLKYWFSGEGINFENLLNSKNSKLNVIDLRFISEEKEKQFFIEGFLQEFFKWLLRQKGTQNLKYLLYFDEIKSFMPSFPSNPPSKKMLDIIIRQGRAFGLGCIFATQNPGDIDYKLLSNINTRFIGKLRTQRDIDKVSTGIDFSKKELTKKISDLKQGEFLYNEQDSNEVDVLKNRWLISYHRGPLSEDEITLLSKTSKGEKVTSKNNEIIKDKENSIKSKSNEFVLPLKWTTQQLVDSIKRDDNVKISIEKTNTVYKPILHTTAYIENKEFILPEKVSLDSNLNKRIHSTYVSEIEDKNITTQILDDEEKQEIFLDRELAENQAVSKIKKIISGKFYISKETNFHSRFKKDVILKNEEIAKNKFHEKLNQINSKFNPVLIQKKEEIKQLQKKLRQEEYKKDLETEKNKDRVKKTNKGKIIKNKVEDIKKEIKIHKKEYKDISKEKKILINKESENFNNNVKNYKEVNFEENNSDIKVKTQLLWVPKQEIIVVIKTKEHEYKTKIIHDSNEIKTLGVCLESKKNIDSLNDLGICSFCAKTFNKKLIHIDSINSKSYCSKHFIRCDISKKKYGIDTLKKCPNCSRRVSPDHLIQCPSCGNVVCEKCIITKGIFKKTPIECKLCKKQK